MALAEVDDLAAIFFGETGPNVANVAACRKGQNGPESEQRRHLSQMSQMSQGAEAKSTATPTTPTTKASPTPDSLALVAWTDTDIARFTARRDRLTRWGYPTTDAEALAERLTLRDRSGDERVSCTECAHYRPGRCSNHRAARLHSPEVGSDLAALLQRCPGASEATGR